MDFSAILDFMSLKIFRLITAFLLVLTPNTSVVVNNNDNIDIKGDPSIEAPMEITSILKNKGSEETLATTTQNRISEDIEKPAISDTTIIDLQKKVNNLVIEVNKQISNTVGELQTFSLSDINNDTRKALVNILCLSDTYKLRSITGSGVFVDPRGVILTNAHIGQYFLLKDYPIPDSVHCVIRSGSPAKPLYKAKLLYLPTSWVNANPTTLVESNPSGTGEHDYAFLLLTEAIDPQTTLPESFPHLQMFIGDGDISVGDTTVIAGYAAGFLGGATVEKELYSVSAVAKIREIFTFGENNLDLVSIGGSIVAQKGSSGGAVVNGSNNLIGIIVTSTEAQNTADRDLRAITISHINRSLIKNRGSSISAFLLGDIASKADQYNSTEALNLRDILIKNIEKVSQ